jgi:hypothetical protein
MADGQAGSRAGSVPVRARPGVGQATLLPSPECVSAGLGVSARSADRARGVSTGRKRASLASSNSWWTYASLRAARRRAVLAHPRRGFCGCCVAVIGITSHKAEPACISGLFTLDTGVVWRAGVRLAQAAWRRQGRTSVTVSSVDDGRWTAACCGGAVVRVSRRRPCPNRAAGSGVLVRFLRHQRSGVAAGGAIMSASSRRSPRCCHCCIDTACPAVISCPRWASSWTPQPGCRRQ